MKIWLIAQAKHEQDYIYEWTEYHLKLGIDKIIIVDNEDKNSSVDYNEILKDFKNNIQIIDHRGEKDIQNHIYDDIYHTIKPNECDYVGVIDIDEYVYGCANIKQFIESLDNFDILALNWKIVPLNNQIYKENKRLEERFKNVDMNKDSNSSENKYKKCFYKTGKSFFIWIHNARKIKENIIMRNADNKILKSYTSPIMNDKEKSNKVFIKHYFYKSLEQFIIKCTYPRGSNNSKKRKLRNYSDLLKQINNNLNLVKQICKKNNIKFNDIY